MRKSDELRKKAEHCTKVANNTESAEKKARYRRMADSWNSLAARQAWVDGETPQTKEDLTKN